MYYLLFSLSARVTEKQVITIIFSDKTVLFVVKDIHDTINIIKYVSNSIIKCSTTISTIVIFIYNRNEIGPLSGILYLTINLRRSSMRSMYLIVCLLSFYSNNLILCTADYP